MAGIQKQKSGETIKKKPPQRATLRQRIKPGFITAASAELIRNVGKFY